jgi:membrane protease YdiL (CAAX protease family)
MAMVIVATFVLLRVGGASLASLGLRRARLLREIGLGLAGVALLSALLLGAIAALEGWAAASSTWATVMGYGMGDRAFYFGIGVVAALTEEPLFRGYLQPALMGKLGAIGGLAITALVFAAVHPVVYAWPLTPLIGKLIHGLTLGLMRGRDRSLVGPMVTHASLWAIWGGA